MSIDVAISISSEHLIGMQCEFGSVFVTDCPRNHANYVEYDNDCDAGVSSNGTLVPLIAL